MGAKPRKPITAVPPSLDADGELDAPPSSARSRQPRTHVSQDRATSQKTKESSTSAGDQPIPDPRSPARLRRHSKLDDLDEWVDDENLDELEEDDTEGDLSEFEVRPKKKPARLGLVGGTRKKSRKKKEELATVGDPSGGDEFPVWRRHLYWVLLFALIPLASSLFWSQNDTTERLRRTLMQHPELAHLAAEGSTNDFLMALPDKKIDGALLPRDTMTHWTFALVSTVFFLGVISFLFRTRRAPPMSLFWRGLLIGTVGIALLLVFQLIAITSNAVGLRRAHPVVWIIFFAVQFIGYSYRCALDPNNGFFESFVGFTCGVGLCEEACKASLLLLHFRFAEKTAGWGTACAWGLACGAGFGVSEGIHYSGDMYNGLATADMYYVRFISCVTLHAIWSGCVAILMYRSRELFAGDAGWGDWIIAFIQCFWGSILLHGLYDTFLKKDMELWALGIALVSFFWLAYLIEESRKRTKKSNRLALA